MTPAELKDQEQEQRTKELMAQASAAIESADTAIKEVKDAGIYQAAENVRKAKMQALERQEQKLLGTMDLMLRAPAPAKEKKAAHKQPVSTQVSQKEMDEFVSSLSPACGKQFNAIMGGAAPAIHTFGDAGSNSTAGGCSKLEGSICHTEASIESEKSGPANRQIRSSQHVTGNGCLPRECTAQKDLTSLAGFMHTKAKESVPGTGVHVKLSVDCSESGGAVAKVGYEPDQASPLAPLGVHSSAVRAGVFTAVMAIGASVSMAM